MASARPTSGNLNAPPTNQRPRLCRGTNGEQPDNRTTCKSGKPITRFGKPDATGRSSNKLPERLAKLRRPPKGEPWAWLTRELLTSPAWRSRSINCVRLIDCLLADDMSNAGTENGNLKATYDQLEAWGATRSAIRSAVEEAEFLGLVQYDRGGRYAGSNQPSTYRLTFYADRYGSPPTNEWKPKTEEQIAKWKREQTLCKQARRQKQIGSATSRTTKAIKWRRPMNETSIIRHFSPPAVVSLYELLLYLQEGLRPEPPLG